MSASVDSKRCIEEIMYEEFLAGTTYRHNMPTEKKPKTLRLPSV